MKNQRKIILAFLFLIYKLITFSSEYTIEELNQLRDLNLISIDDYEVLKAELLQGSAVQENLYSLKVDGKKLSNTYEVFWEGGEQYLSLQDFFSAINFTNFYLKTDKVEIYLGETLEKIELKDGKVFKAGEEIAKVETYQKYIIRNQKVFVEKRIFEQLFLSYLKEDTQKSEITMELNFTPPVAIDKLLDISIEKMKREEEKQELIFSGKRELFNLGYMRIDAGNTWARTEEDKSYKSDWDGTLSYQGGLLYGEFSFDYDMKEKEFSNFSLDYDQIWKGHTLEVNKSSFDSDGEWGFHFYKDKGYYEIGDTIVIRERVPVGARAELIYMGTPIAIEDEENGEVVFSNSMIRSDRDYQLKVYYPDGKIVLKDIRTSEDYNRQAKGELEYDISMNENAEDHGYNTDINFYYGISDHLTFGAGINREITKTDTLKKDYMTTISSEITYGDTINGYSYTLQLNGERTLDRYYDDTFKNLEDRNQWGYLAEVTKNKWRTKFEQIRYAEYYDEKEENYFKLSYDVTDSLRLDYNYDTTKYRTDDFGKRNPTDKSSTIGVSYDKTIGGILFGTSVNIDLEDSKNNEYSFNAYYSGFKAFTTRLENTWTNNGEDYEASLEIYNNNLGGFLDISAELRYSNVEKETFGLTFSMTLDSWFTVDVDGDEHGNNSVRVGVDKIIDLKNPRLEVDNMDVSRAKIITFVDQNNNNMYDKGETRIEGVEVNLGTHRVVTDKNGEARLYNLSNGIIYELQPTIKKPSYTMGNNIIKIKSNFSSDVEVYIPIKPMMTLSGYVNLDKSLDIPEQKVEEFYSNIIVQILSKDGKEIDLASPDNTGYFDISGLFPEEYLLKVYYTGNDYKILNANEKLQLKYDEENGFDFEIQLNVTDDEIELLDKQKLVKLEEEKIAQNQNTSKKGRE